MKKLLLFLILCMTGMSQILLSQVTLAKTSDLLLHNPFPGAKQQNANSSMPDNHSQASNSTQAFLIDSNLVWVYDTVIHGWHTHNDLIYNNYNYDVGNNLLGNLLQDWKGSYYADSGKYINTYSGDNLITSTFQVWNSSAFVDYYKYSYAYDDNNNLTSAVYQHNVGAGLAYYVEYIYTYDNNNKLATQTVLLWNGDVFTNYLLYTYNAGGASVQYWSTSYVNYALITDNYDGNNNLISETEQLWNSSAYVNSSRVTYTYDGNNNLTSQLSEYWNGTAYVSSSLFVKTYDVNNVLVSQVRKFYANNGVTISSGDSSHAYYHSVVTGLDNATAGKLSIYPNPAVDKITIDETTSAIDKNNIYIYTAEGRLQDELTPDFRHTIDVSNLRPGIYFLQLHTTNGWIINRFIKE